MSMLSRPATASIAAEPVSPLVAPTIVRRLVAAREELLEQQAEQLQRDVLERQRRAVEQLEQPVPLVELHQRGHRGVGEAAVGLRCTARAARPRRQAVADERRHDPRGELGIGQPGQRGDLGLA